jgi:hypothetical protein
MFKTFFKKHVDKWLFVSKIFFPYQIFTKSFQKIYEFQYIPQKGIHVFKIFEKSNTYTLLDFDSQTSLSIIKDSKVYAKSSVNNKILGILYKRTNK